MDTTLRRLFLWAKARRPVGSEIRPTELRTPPYRLAIAVIAAVGAGFALTVIFPLDAESRWSVYLLLLTVLAAVLLALLYRTAPDVPPLSPPPRAPRPKSGELARLVTVLGRAHRGLRYSQGLVATRTREAFLARVKTSRGLSGAEMARIAEDPTALRKVVADPTIVEFLETTPPEEELLLQLASDRPPVFDSADGEPFTKRIARVVRAMEAWD